VTELGNVLLHVGYLILLPFVLFHLVLLLLGTGAHIRIVVACREGTGALPTVKMVKRLQIQIRGHIRRQVGRWGGQKPSVQTTELFSYLRAGFDQSKDAQKKSNHHSTGKSTAAYEI
jgi:hypothetical protein